MCLGIPGKIVETLESGRIRMGRIDYGGIIKEACLAYVPEAKIGDYVIVHAGFALNVLSPEEAEETLKTLQELEDLGRVKEISTEDAGKSRSHGKQK